MPNPKVKDMPRKQQMAVKASMAEQSAFKMKGFSGFRSPVKLDMELNDKLNKAVRKSEAKEFLRKNTIKPKVKKPLSRPFGPGTRPLARNVSRGLKAFGRTLGIVGAVASLAPTVVKGMKAVMPGLKKRAKKELKGRSIYTSSKI